MYDRMGGPRTVYNQENSDNKLGPTKTAIVFVVVIGCFAVLWPKVFYPMLVGSANQHIKPSPIDRQSGCCDVISELDVKTLKVMSELCSNIIQQEKDAPINNKQALMICRSVVLETCGIDISAVLQEQVRLGQSVKQIIDEVRSLNGSLCLKYNFGVAPWKLGVPHRIVNNPSVDTIRQERPLHLRSEMVHPAFRERGRAIPQPQSSSLPPKPTPRMVPGRPGPIPGLRPTIGGAGHVVPSKQQSVGGTMGLIMPIYTIAIVVFFSYTVLKLFTKKKPETMAAHLYPSVEPDPQFRKEVFEKRQQAPSCKREAMSSKLVVNAMSALLDEVDEELEARRKASQLAQEEVVASTNLQNGKAVIPEEDQPTVKVLGLEVTASCEGDKKWNRSESPLLPSHVAAPPLTESLPPPQEIFLEGALPAQSHLLVSNSTTEPEPETGDNEAVVLASKMTLSVISLDSSENGTDESSSDKKSEPIVIIGEDDLKASSKGSSSSNGSDDFEKIEADLLEEQINDIIEEAKHIMENQTASDIVDEVIEGEKLQLGQKDDVEETVNDENDYDSLIKVNVEDILKVKDIIESEQAPVTVKLPDEKHLTQVEVDYEVIEGEKLQLGQTDGVDETKHDDNLIKVNVEEILKAKDIIESEQTPLTVKLPDEKHLTQVEKLQLGQNDDVDETKNDDSDNENLIKVNVEDILKVKDIIESEQAPVTVKLPDEKHLTQVDKLGQKDDVVETINDETKDDNLTKVNVEEILEVEEIIEIEEKPITVGLPDEKHVAQEERKEAESDEKEKVADKTKSSASSGTVEDIEELLSRDDELDDELNEQIEYEPSDIGSEELLDEVRQTDRISEERDDINDLLEKYGGESENEEEDEDEIVDVQEEVEYLDDEEEEEGNMEQVAKD